MTPLTVAQQAPLSVGPSRQEGWGGLPFPPPGDLPDQESNLRLLVSCTGRSSPLVPLGRSKQKLDSPNVSEEFLHVSLHVYLESVFFFFFLVTGGRV